MQHELNPRHEDATVEARIAVANETAGQPQAQTLPIGTVPGTHAPLGQGQFSASVNAPYRGLGSSERIESKERVSRANVSSGGSDTPMRSREPYQGKTFVPSTGKTVNTNERDREAKKERDTISWQQIDDPLETVGLAGAPFANVDAETHKKAGPPAHTANHAGAGIKDIRYDPEKRWEPPRMPRGATVYNHKDLIDQYPEPKTAKMVKALPTL